MTYVHRKLQFHENPFMPRSMSKVDRHSERAAALALAMQKGKLPSHKEFINLCGATSDIVLWLEVEEPALAEAMPIRHTWIPKPGWILADGPGEINQAYEVAFRNDGERAEWASERSDGLTVLWQRLSTFPAHWWLSQQPGWTSAFGALEWKARQPGSVSYRHGLARFRLLHVISRDVGAYLWRKREGWEPDVVSSAEIRKALGHVKALLKVLTPGVHLISPMEIAELEASLIVAETILGGPEVKIPKKRRDETLLERRFLEDVITGLNGAFGELSPTLVGHIASIAGYDMPETTLRRIRASTQAKEV